MKRKVHSSVPKPNPSNRKNQEAIDWFLRNHILSTRVLGPAEFFMERDGGTCSPIMQQSRLTSTQLELWYPGKIRERAVSEQDTSRTVS